MEKPILPYLFFGLLALNLLVLGYYNFVKSNDTISDGVKVAQSQLKNPVTFSNVSSELPPLIGTKK